MKTFLLLAIVVLSAGCLMQPYNAPSEAPAASPPAATEPNVSENATSPPVSECSGPVCGADSRTYATDCDADVAGVTVLYRTECVLEGNCSETDTGVEPATAGNVSKGNETRSDHCLDSSQLVEYSCLNNSITQTTISCGSGYECGEGRCVAVSHESNASNITGCTGPSEPDIYTAGSVQYNGSAHPDACVDYRTIKDFYCVDGRMESLNDECPAGYGCTGGACTPYTYSCQESDTGNDTSMRGRTVESYGLLSSFENIDECVDEGTVREYYCLANGSSTHQDVPCGSGKKCDGGRCVNSACSETDGGKNIYVAGKTTAGTVEGRDECITASSLKEYYCYGDLVRSEIIDCGTGYVCEANVCVR